MIRFAFPLSRSVCVCLLKMSNRLSSYAYYYMCATGRPVAGGAADTSQSFNARRASLYHTHRSSCCCSAAVVIAPSEGGRSRRSSSPAGSSASNLGVGARLPPTSSTYDEIRASRQGA